MNEQEWQRLSDGYGTANCRRIDEHTIAVRIDEKATLGQFALAYFVRCIPSPIYRRCASFS